MRKYFYTVLAALAFAGCSEDEALNEANHEILTFSAAMETPAAGSRTILGPKNTVLWSEGDSIAVYAKNQKIVHFGLVGAGNTETGIFAHAGAVEVGPKAHFAAVYPEKAALTLKGGGGTKGYDFTVKVPVNQYYRENSFYDKSTVMVAMSDTTHLKFKNVCGLLKLQLTGDKSISNIEVTGNNNETVAGSVTFNMHAPFDAANDMQWQSAEKKPKTSVKLAVGLTTPVTLDPATPTVFYLSMLPGNFTKGFTVTITDSEGNSMTKSTTNAQKIVRSQILSMPAFTYAPAVK